MELCKLVGTPRVGWAEREVHQLVKKAVLEQGAHLVDMRTEPDIDCTYALSGGATIPARFQKDVVSLAEGLDAQVIPLEIWMNIAPSLGQ